jgi:hypothetical protein
MGVSVAVDVRNKDMVRIVFFSPYIPIAINAIFFRIPPLQNNRFIEDVAPIKIPVS